MSPEKGQGERKNTVLYGDYFSEILSLHSSGLEWHVIRKGGSEARALFTFGKPM